MYTYYDLHQSRIIWEVWVIDQNRRSGKPDWDMYVRRLATVKRIPDPV